MCVFSSFISSFSATSIPFLAPHPPSLLDGPIRVRRSSPDSRLLLFDCDDQATVHLPSPTYDPSSTLTIHSDAPFPSLTLDLSTLSGRVSAHYSSRSGQTTIERRQEGLFVRRSVGRGEGGRLEEDERLVWLALERVLEERVGERLWGTMGSAVR